MQRINQPNRSSMTYWYKSPRGFANEYTVAIARDKYWRDYYTLAVRADRSQARHARAAERGRCRHPDLRQHRHRRRHNPRQVRGGAAAAGWEAVMAIYKVRTSDGCRFRMKYNAEHPRSSI